MLDTPRTKRLALPKEAGLAALLLLIPFVVYAPTVFHRYGFRDDYPILREAQDEPGKILRVCAAQGRALYGWLLERASNLAGDIDGLSRVRLLGALGLGLLGIAVFLLALRARWQTPFAALLGLFVTLTPPAQVLVSWAICSPQVVSLLLGTAAFALAEHGRARTTLLTVSKWLGALLILTAGVLIYQPHSLFYVVPLAAALVTRRQEPFRDTFLWGTKHLVLVGASLLLAFGVMELTFLTRLFLPSTRIRFEDDWPMKLGWTVTEVLPDALAQSALDGGRGLSVVGYWLMVAMVAAMIALGTALQWRQEGKTGAARWVLGMFALSIVAFCISLIVREHYPTYRSIFALTGVWTVYFTASLAKLHGELSSTMQRAFTVAIAGLTVWTAFLAWRQPYELFALPQARELRRLEEAADRAARLPHPRVFVVTATQADYTAPHHYQDEFGTVSIDDGWLAKATFQLLMQERLDGSSAEVAKRYALSTGKEPPVVRDADVLLVDMRLAPEQRQPAPRTNPY